MSEVMDNPINRAFQRSLRFVTQDKFRNSDGHGNCVQAAVASLMAMPLSDVPDFVGLHGTEWELGLADWCDHLGFEVVRFDCPMAFDGFYLASGPGPRECNHMVLMRDGRLAHDPYPDGGGLLSIEHVWLVVPYDPGDSRE